MSQLAIPVNAQDHLLGNINAPIVLVEYADYQCPYCGQAYPVVKRVAETFGDKVAVVFRNYPLVQSHPQAMYAAIVAEFAAEHGKFWQAHDALFEHQRELGIPMYSKIIASLGLSVDDLETALQTRRAEHHIRQDIEGGDRSGMTGTPAFFLNGQSFSPRNGFEDVFEAVQALVQKQPS